MMLTRLGQGANGLQQAMQRWRWASVALLSIVLVACGSSPPAPIEDRNRRTPGDGRQYVVQRGDTLYSIAFRYGLDFRKVAAANKISSPYTIYPGQRVVLKEAAVPPPQPAQPAPQAAVSKPAPKPVSKTVKPVTKPPQSQSKTGNAAPETAYTGSKVSGWRWPTAGKVTRKYSSTVHKGIDIAGQRGDAIHAVAAGKVVYAGTGIVGFGDLLTRLNKLSFCHQ